MVFVLDKPKRPLMPCSEKRARLLLQRGRAAVHRVHPFTIRLRGRTIATSVVQPVVLKIDPGAQTTGLAVVREEQAETGSRHHALHLAAVQHQGMLIHDKLLRTRLGLPKTHALDALCVGDIAAVGCFPMPVVGIRAKGRGTHCRTTWTAQGFPRGYTMHHKLAWGFQTGDVVCAVMPTGKHAGTHVGRLAVRASGKFRVGDRDGIDWRRCRLVQRADGYEYMLQRAWRALPTAQSQDVHAIGVEWSRRS